MGSTLDSCLNKKSKEEASVPAKNNALPPNSSYEKGAIRDNRKNEKSERKEPDRGSKGGSRKPTDVVDKDEEGSSKKLLEKKRSDSGDSDEDMFQSKPIQPFDLKKDDPHQTMKREGLPLTTLSTTSADFNIVDDNSANYKQNEISRLLNVQNPDIFCNKTIKVSRPKNSSNQMSISKTELNKDEGKSSGGADKESKDTDTIDKNFFDKKSKKPPQSPTSTTEDTKSFSKAVAVDGATVSDILITSDPIIKDKTLVKGGASNENKDDAEIQLLMNKNTIEKK